MSNATALEKRQFGRRRLTAHAWVLINRRQPLACVIRDISERGALLEFPDFAPPQSTFRLLIEEPWFEAGCDVKHRRGRALGVYFADAVVSDTDVASGPSGKQLAALMRERLAAAGDE